MSFICLLLLSSFWTNPACAQEVTDFNVGLPPPSAYEESDEGGTLQELYTERAALLSQLRDLEEKIRTARGESRILSLRVLRELGDTDVFMELSAQDALRVYIERVLNTRHPLDACLSNLPPEQLPVRVVYAQLGRVQVVLVDNPPHDLPTSVDGCLAQQIAEAFAAANDERGGTPDSWWRRTLETQVVYGF